MQNLLPREELEHIKYHLHRLGHKNLREYYESEWWKYRRAKFWRDHGYRCRCGATWNLNVNHKTYAHMGYEYDADLEGLCEQKCHKRYHIKLTKRVRKDLQRTKKAPGKRRGLLDRLLFG